MARAMKQLSKAGTLDDMRKVLYPATLFAGFSSEEAVASTVTEWLEDRCTD